MEDQKAKPKIIIVEDERPMAEALRMKFEKEGFDVTTAGDGEEAYRILTEGNTFNIMLLDLIMPRLDGFSLLRKMRETGYNVPVLITSNLSQGSDIQLARELGVKEYIIKSNAKVSDIVSNVRGYLGMDPMADSPSQPTADPAPVEETPSEQPAPEEGGEQKPEGEQNTEEEQPQPEEHQG